MNVRQRHLGGRNQKEIPVAGDLEEIGFELRQLARRFERRAIDEIRRHDLQVPVLARVQVEHEIGQRSRQPRARAEQHRKPGAGHLRGALEVENAKRRPEIPVRQRFEIELSSALPTCARRRCPLRSCRRARSHAAGWAATSAATFAAARPDRARCRAAESAAPADDWLRRCRSRPCPAASRAQLRRPPRSARASTPRARESAAAAGSRASRAARARRRHSTRGSAARVSLLPGGRAHKPDQAW